jgi:hypothetical protein
LYRAKIVSEEFIQMKADRLFVAAVVALMSSSLPSLAGNPNIDQHYYRAPVQVQILPNGPLVTDHRPLPTQAQTYIIEAPQQAQPAPPPVMIRPGQAPGATIIQSGLQNAGFQSAMPPAGPGGLGGPGALSRNLADGKSTNMLAGKMNQPPRSVAATSRPLAVTPQQASIPSTPKTLVYPSQPSSSGMSGQNVSTAVSGQIQRGSLLANHVHH